MTTTTKDPKEMNSTEAIEYWNQQKLENENQPSSDHELNSQRQDVESVHTPTPWVASPIRNSRNTGMQYIEIEHRTGPKTATMVCQIDSDYLCVDALGPIDEANAELICKAVNSYEALTAENDALRAAIEAKATWSAIQAGLGASEWEAFLWPEARAAISLATGGQKDDEAGK